MLYQEQREFKVTYAYLSSLEPIAITTSETTKDYQEIDETRGTEVTSCVDGPGGYDEGGNNGCGKFRDSAERGLKIATELLQNGSPLRAKAVQESL
jgi:hypothetical protein